MITALEHTEIDIARLGGRACRCLALTTPMMNILTCASHVVLRHVSGPGSRDAADAVMCKILRRSILKNTAKKVGPILIFPILLAKFAGLELPEQAMNWIIIII